MSDVRYIVINLNLTDRDRKYVNKKEAKGCSFPIRVHGTIPGKDQRSKQEAHL